MVRTALILWLFLLAGWPAAWPAWAQEGGSCAQCHLGRTRQETGSSLGQLGASLLWPGQGEQQCPALSPLGLRLAALEERLALLALGRPGLASQHYPLDRLEPGLARVQALHRRLLAQPLSSLEEAGRLLDQLDQALHQEVELVLRQHEDRLARLRGWGLLGLAVVCAALCGLWSWRRLKRRQDQDAPLARAARGELP